VEASSFSYSSWECNYRREQVSCPQLSLDPTNQIDGHGIEWNYWCPITHFLPSHKPLFFWVLAELLQCCQSSCSRDVLVRGPGWKLAHQLLHQYLLTNLRLDIHGL
jgi:hypothetical protein